MVLSNSQWLANPGVTYEIDQSIRFNFSDGAHMLRTPSTASNRRTWTWSLWVKRSGLGNPGGPNQVHQLFGVGAGSCLRFTPSDELRLESPAGNHTFVTSQVFRDTSAWYHIVLAFDSTQATDTDRRKLYVNGSQVTDFSSTTFTGLAQNAEWDINSTSQHQIAKSNLADYFGGYLAELNFVDGSALAPTEFAETDADTGQWVPVRYAGSYGVNGYYLKGEDSSNLGNDSSGNNNDWTSSGLTAADQVSDSPTDNFCTLNPLITPATMTFTDGNLALSGYTAVTSAYGTFGMSSGKWYWELVAQTNAMAGVAATPNGSQYPGQAADSYAFDLTNGTKYNNGSSSAFGSGSVSAGDTVGVAFDADNGDLKFYDNSGTLIGTAFSGLTSGPYFPVFRNGSAANISVNFGQQTFSHSLPTSHVALSTANLPAPSIPNPSAYFGTLTWSGDSSNKNITGLEFTPDFLWIKQRNSAFSVGHQLYDVVRGAGSENELDSSSTAAEGAGNPNVYGYPSAFVSGGFTATAGSSGDWDYVNKSGVTYVAWNWLADNTSGSSNTDGATSSTVSVSTTSNFSIVKWTGTGATTTVGHGLGTTPQMMIIKNLADADSWVVYHEALGATKGLTLDTTAAATTASTFFNNTAPTSSVFTVGASGRANGSGDGQIAYCFAEVEGFSKFTSYEGNASTDGPFIYCGFRPSFVMIKNADNGTESWWIQDAAREPFNDGNMARLAPDSSAAEADNVPWFDFVSNGLKVRYNAGGINSSGTHIVMAFAESPFKTATAR